MADDIKRINVRIGGMSYQLVSAENENYTRQIAAKADEMIRRVMQNNPQLSLNMSTILALVNAVDELSRANQQLNTIDSQRLQTENQAAENRKELMRLREQNWEMKKELLRLGALCRDYEALLEKATAVEPPDQNSFTDELDCIATQKTPENPDILKDEVPTVDRLTQTNIEDYLRANGWQQPNEPDKYDDTEI